MTIVTIICRHREGESVALDTPSPPVDMSCRVAASASPIFPLAGQVLSGTSPGTWHQVG